LKVHDGVSLRVGSSHRVVGKVLRKQTVNSQRHSTHYALYTAHYTAQLANSATYPIWLDT